MGKNTLLNLLIALPLLFGTAVPVLAQNGADRGGGDTYAAEFNSVRRQVMSNLDTWIDNGTLTLSAESLAQLRRLEPSVYVFSQDRVTLDETHEVDAVNLPGNNPPLIILGRQRWEAKSGMPIERELLVLHELLSVVGIQDRYFEVSYGVKLRTAASWEEHRAHVLDELKHLNELALRMFSLDLSNLETFVKTAMLSSDYRECIAHSGSSRRARKAQKKYCVPLLDVLDQANDVFLMDNMQANYVELGRQMNAIVHTLNAFFQSIPTSETKLLFPGVVEYTAEYERLRKANTSTKNENAVVDFLLRACPSRNDLSFTIQCSFEHVLSGFETAFAKPFDDSRVAIAAQFERTAKVIQSLSQPSP